MRRLVTALLVAIALVATGCAEASFRLDESRIDIDEPVRPGDRGDGPSLDADAVARAALSDVEEYWSRTFEDLYGAPFEPVTGGFVAFGPRSDIPDCGPERLEYDLVAGNAFYCPADDYIAWDEDQLIPDLQDAFGPFTIGIVMAHEYAHAVQARAGADGRTVTLELQADCFAGAWTADVEAGNARYFEVSGEDLDRSIAGFLELRDGLGVGADDPEAHGSGFDRVNAFQDGLESGPERCAGYVEDPPVVIEILFSTLDDLRREGNLPTDELIEPLLADLEHFYEALFSSAGSTWDPVDDLVVFDPDEGRIPCGDEAFDPDDLPLSFYCGPDDSIYLDGDTLLPSLEAIGDFAIGGEVARQYALAAQVRMGITEDTEATDLHADCLTGVFTAAEFREVIPEQRLTLSPGDVDEIIVAFLSLDDPDQNGDVFDRTSAFRSGFFDGDEACDALL